MEYQRRLAICRAATLATDGHPLPFPVLTPGSDRQTLIDWLELNDPNGTYADDDSLAEFDAVMTLDEGWEIIERQTEDYTPDHEAWWQLDVPPGSTRRPRQTEDYTPNHEGDLRKLSIMLWESRVRLAGFDPETVTVEQESTMRGPLATAQDLIDRAVESIEQI